MGSKMLLPSPLPLASICLASAKDAYPDARE